MKPYKLILIGMIACCVSCSIDRDGTFRDRNGNILTAPVSEIAETQRILLDKQIPDNLPESAEGGVLFDGKVVSVHIAPNGLYTTLFSVDKPLFGDLTNCRRILVLSPSPQKTGIDFKKGEKYRVFSVYIEDAYRTWDWLGTVKLKK